MRKKPPAVRDVAAAIIERADKGNVLILSNPPSLEQRLHMIAARLDGRPFIVIQVTKFADQTHSGS